MNHHKSKIFKSAAAFLLALIMAFCPLVIQSSAASTGDVNADGKINSVDALMVLQQSTKSISLSAEAKKLADVNGDGTINSSDALDILLVATGMKAGFSSSQKPTSSYKGTVTAEPSLRLREGTNTSSAILVSIPYGTTLTITEEKSGWGKTTYAGKTGWVSLDYISKEGTSSGKTGTFTITCYGFGHGVGMSQWGAITYAEQGWTYDKILLHYYHSDKTKIVKDTNMPSTVTFGGQTIDLKKYIACSTYAETGDSVAYESIKSLMVAIYTFAKYYNFNVESGTHEYNPNYNWKGTAIESAMNEVLGQYVSYDGKPALTVYCSSVGGKTTSSTNAWGSSPAPAYLSGGRTSPEPESISKRVYTYTAAQIKDLAQKNMGVTLTGDPTTWFTEINHDKSVNSTTGYIASMKVGGKVIKGDQIRTKLFAYQIRSHCLNIKYNP